MPVNAKMQEFINVLNVHLFSIKFYAVKTIFLLQLCGEQAKINYFLSTTILSALLAISHAVAKTSWALFSSNG